MLTDNKSAILIVEFAKLARERGTPLLEAALEAACLRLRPIIMTSFAFILGCVPLWTASGSDAVARRVERFGDRRGERAAQDAVRAGTN
jgi:HAE1 family hydrophobic/amphiphilic exporter-1